MNNNPSHTRSVNKSNGHKWFVGSYYMNSLTNCISIFNENRKNHATYPKLCWSYYPHRSRDSLSPVCGIFINLMICKPHKNLKSVDIGLWGVGAKRPLNGVRKYDGQTDRNPLSYIGWHRNVCKKNPA